MTENNETYIPSVGEILGEVSATVEIVEEAFGLGKLLMEAGIPENLGAIPLTLKAGDITLVTAGVGVIFALTDDPVVREHAKALMESIEREQIAVDAAFTDKEKKLIEDAQRKVAMDIGEELLAEMVPDALPEGLDGGLGSA